MSRLFLIILGTLFFFGCHQGEDTRHPTFILGERCREDGDYLAAERQFRRFLARRPESAAGHLAMASLYDENFKNFSAAIFHYNEFLRIEPDSPDSDMIKSWQAVAERKYRDQLNTKDLPLPDIKREDFEDLELENKKLWNHNNDLRRMLLHQQRLISELRKEVATIPQAKLDTPIEVASPSTVTPTSEKASSPSNKTIIYEVQAGDTLSLIARKYYGASSKYTVLLEANNLTKTSTLRVGQKIKIPSLDSINN